APVVDRARAVGPVARGPGARRQLGLLQETENAQRIAGVAGNGERDGDPARIAWPGGFPAVMPAGDDRAIRAGGQAQVQQRGGRAAGGGSGGRPPGPTRKKSHRRSARTAACWQAVAGPVSSTLLEAK